LGVELLRRCDGMWPMSWRLEGRFVFYPARWSNLTLSPPPKQCPHYSCKEMQVSLSKIESKRPKEVKTDRVERNAAPIRWTALLCNLFLSVYTSSMKGWYAYLFCFAVALARRKIGSCFVRISWNQHIAWLQVFVGTGRNLPIWFLICVEYEKNSTEQCLWTRYTFERRRTGMRVTRTIT